MAIWNGVDESPTTALVGVPNEFARRVAPHAQDPGRAAGSLQYKASSRTQSGAWVSAPEFRLVWSGSV